MLVGYARVSTQDQKQDLQTDALTAAGCEKIFTEKASGAKSDRPELNAALDYIRAGDTLVVWKLDRLARSIIRERTNAGLVAARARGKKGGRPPALTDKEIQAAKAMLADPDITVEEVAARLKVATSTLYRHLQGGRGSLSE
jgi:DNA invertase Pin-like site-specific DNA recombinase